MATPEYVYEDPFPLGKDDTEYRLLTKDHVSVTSFMGKDILKVEPEALALVAQEGMRDVSFLLRTAHLKQVAAILKDPEASENDRYVAQARRDWKAPAITMTQSGWSAPRAGFVSFKPMYGSRWSYSRLRPFRSFFSARVFCTRST